MTQLRTLAAAGLLGLAASSATATALATCDSGVTTYAFVTRSVNGVLVYFGAVW